MLFRKAFQSGPDCPSRIPKEHLTQSRLLDPKKNAAEIEHIRRSLADCPDGYYSKKDAIFKNKSFSSVDGQYLQYSVIKENNHFYIVYRGKKHGMAIAEGGFGVLKYAQDLVSGQFVAVKVINPLKHKRFAETTIDITWVTQSIRSESDILNSIHRLPSYADSRQVFDQKHAYYLHKRKEQLPDKTKFVLVMDLEKGDDVFSYLMKHRETLFDYECLLIAKNMVAEWRAHYAKGILHRDIKLENFMIDANLRVKLIDFGSSVRINPSEAKPYVLDREPCGTKSYQSPELATDKRYSEQTEVYAMGATFDYLYQYGFNKAKNENEAQLKPIRSAFAALRKAMRSENPEKRPLMSAVESDLDRLLVEVDQAVSSSYAASPTMDK